MSDIGDLSRLINNDALRSSIRILILISLAINEKMYFTDILNLMGIGRGSLSNHLDILIHSGYIKDKTVFTLSGPRRMLEITDKGKIFYNNYIKIINEIGLNPRKKINDE
jgi:DNA-binding MarR family transcriptional regulator